MMPETFSDLFEQSHNARLKLGSIIEAEVLEVQSEVVIVNVGLKSEGIIPIQQFKDEKGEVEVREGDTVEVALDAIEDGFGETRLSREKAKRVRIWKKLEEVYEKNEIISGVIVDRVKGGFTVDLDSVTGFLPGSLVDVRPVRNTTHLHDKMLDFKIIKLDQRRNNIVLSRRAVLEGQYNVEREALLERLEEGITIKGIVKNLTDYGAFLDLGGVDGLLHITDMAWRRIKHPSELLSIGDEIQVKVLEYDKEKKRVSLGLKQLGEDPWAGVGTRYPPDTRITGKITNIADYGCFVEIEEGIEGLVHVSEMSWTNRHVHPEKMVSVGDDVEVMVLSIDDKRRRISLGIKQCQQNPWEEFSGQYKKGDKVNGRVKSSTDFGLFVGIEESGLDGLVHIGDISWAASGEESIRKYKKGDEVSAVIVSIDVERERICLDIKQLEENPIGSYLSEHSKGEIVKGRVKSVDGKQVTLELAKNVNGTIRADEFAGDEATPVEGDEIEAKFIDFDKKRYVLNLSLRGKEQEEQKKVIESYAARQVQATESLGSIVKDKLREEDPH